MWDSSWGTVFYWLLIIILVICASMYLYNGNIFKYGAGEDDLLEAYIDE